MAHGQAAAADSKVWRSLTRELHDAPSHADPSALLPNKPIKALKALASSPLPPSRDFQVSSWPLYEAALIGAGRSNEAKPFTRLIADTKLLAQAMLAGDEVTMKRLIAADIPLTPRKEFLIPALGSHPRLNNLFVNALLGDGEVETLSDVLCSGDAAARQALLTTDAFRSRRDILFKLYDAATEHYRYSETDASALTALWGACTAEQVAALLKRGGPADAPVTLQPLRRVISSEYDQQGHKLAVILPAWIAAGGNPTDALCSISGLSAAVVNLLVQYGANPDKALQQLLTEKYSDDAEGHSTLRKISELLRHGTRPTRAQLDAYFELHAASADTFDKPYGFGRVLREFEKHNVIQAAAPRATAWYRRWSTPGMR